MKKLLLRSLYVLLGLLLLVWFGGKWILSFSTADYSGEKLIANLHNPVEVTFDARGIPQIWAETNDDVYTTLGWLHASERLFQMELVRRMSKGELSEVFGRAAFEVDLFQRQIGFARKAQADAAELSSEARATLTSYCNGINQWIAAKTILPPEFVILQFKPAPWTPEDCMVVALYQTWYSHALMDRDEDYAKLIEKFGTDAFDLFTKYKTWSPPTIKEGLLSSLFQQEAFPLRMTNASNSWVVAPHKSTSKHAIHASDPHLVTNQIPGFWYIAGLHSQEGLNVVGVTVPGMPFVSMGHNGQIAYAFTVASVDIIDYYTARLNAVDSTQILTEKGYEEVTTTVEEISVKGESEPEKITVRATSLGVIIKQDAFEATILKWAGFDFSAADIIENGMKLQAVDDFDSFRQAVTGLGALNVNWTYSDKNGNIGYQLGVPIPIRSYANTYSKLAAEQATNNWQGYLPLAETPHILNPAEGWLASCNNQIVSEKLQTKLPGFYDPYRITRANALLGAKDKFSRDELGEMQLDMISGLSLRWKSLFASGAGKLGKPMLRSKIDAWEGNMSEDSEIALLFSYWWRYMAQAIFEDDIGSDWASGHLLREEVLTENITEIIDDQRTEDKVETKEDMSEIAVGLALTKAANRKLGEVSKLRIRHPLARVKILDIWLDLNRGPFELGGNNGSLNSNFNYYDEKDDRFYSVVGPSMRFILDWSDVDAFTMNVAMGQSGNPFSNHYDDFIEDHKKGERWNVPFSKEKVFANKVNLLTLKPKK